MTYQLQSYGMINSEETYWAPVEDGTGSELYVQFKAIHHAIDSLGIPELEANSVAYWLQYLNGRSKNRDHSPSVWIEAPAQREKKALAGLLENPEHLELVRKTCEKATEILKEINDAGFIVEPADMNIMGLHYQVLELKPHPNGSHFVEVELMDVSAELHKLPASFIWAQKFFLQLKSLQELFFKSEEYRKTDEEERK